MRRFHFRLGKWSLSVGGLIVVALIGIASNTWASGDVGTLVITLNRPAPPLFDRYDLTVETLDGRSRASFGWGRGWFSDTPNDLASVGGDGVVLTKELPAGQYVVSFYEMKVVTMDFFPHDTFSIPFTIRAGRATYIGSYQPICVTQKGLFGGEVAAGGRLVISDQSARDIPIGRAKNPNLGPVDVDVFDVDKLKNPLLSMGRQ
jgi:hypothetical protein